MKLPELKDIKELKGKTALLRAALNVPLKDDAVLNQFRLMRALPTINYLKDKGARTVIIAHQGREKSESLKPVHEVLSGIVGAKWCPSVTGKEVEQAVKELKDGEVLLLENLRSDERETANDKKFAKELASYADVYVNDAFSDSHREHASIVGVPMYLPSYFGINFAGECRELSKAMKPKSPSLLILGGAKFETKLPLIDAYANTYTDVFIGGALANDIFKAKGYEVGRSRISDIDLRDSALLNHLNLLLPVDVRVKSERGIIRVCEPDGVKADETILDAGPESIKMLDGYITNAKFILWNGPLGDYEQGFVEETEKLAKLIAKAEGYSIVGGGDTIASIESLALQDQFGFLSTAGGAMLTYLEKGTLPGIEAVVGK